MPTEEEIAEFMETPEGALELQKIMEDLKTASPTGGALGQISDSELEQFRAASPTGGALGQISDSELEQFRAASPTGGEIGQIGASPNIRGATIGLPPEISGINPVEENEKNRRRMMQQLMPSRGRGLGLGYR
jgi:hypothetical protein